MVTGTMDLEYESIRINLLLMAGIFTALNQNFKYQNGLVVIGLFMLTMSIILSVQSLLDDINLHESQDQISLSSLREAILIHCISGIIFVMVAFANPYISNSIEQQNMQNGNHPVFRLITENMFATFPFILVGFLVYARMRDMRPISTEYKEEIKRQYINFGKLTLSISVTVLITMYVL